jgi:hypothetical protein
MLSGSSTYGCIKYVTIVARTITNVTAPVIPTAVESFLETPINGQIPKNCINTILLTSMADITIAKISIIQLFMIFLID